MQLQVTNIHRRSNGTLDTDVYRQRAILLRRETTNQILRRLGRSARPLLGAIAILVSYALLLPRNPVPQGAASIARAGQGLSAVRFTENAKIESS
jgi:hypothetical protein